MKRHPSLHPLSRDHHEGLLLCWSIREALERGEADRHAVFERFLREWKGWLPSHFEEEESWFPKLGASSQLLARLAKEHDAIRALGSRLVAMGVSAPESEALGEFAALLHDHIRWEERELFPEIEREASEESLRALGEAMRAMEISRPRNCSIDPSAPQTP